MMTHWGEGMPTPFDLIGNIKCPVYGFFGDLDKNPSPADVDKFEASLQRHNIPHVLHRYPDADHGFQNPARARPRTPRELSVADEAWATMLSLMAKNHPARSVGVPTEASA
jgi:dienelactone hydrolase